MQYRRALAAIALVSSVGLVDAMPPPNPAMFYPEDFGGLVPVVGNDSVPDNVAIQAAITAAGAVGGHVVLSQMYDVESRSAKPIGNPWRTFGIVVTGNLKPIMIRADGGGGLRAVGKWYGATTSLLAVHKNIGAVTIRDVFVDMSQRCAGIDEEVENCLDEQQHGVQLDIGAKHVRIEDLTIFHPSLGPSAGGDCVRMLGGYTQADLVEDVVVRGLVGLACDRSLLSFQRSVHGVTADHLVSMYADDNDIDMEATGTDPNDELTWIQDVTIRSALVLKNGGNGITLGRGIRLRVLDSAIIGGGIFSVSCRDCTIANGTFLQHPNSVDAPIGIIRTSERMKLLHNRVGRLPGSTTTTPLVYIAANNGMAPRDTLVEGNDFAASYNVPALRADNADMTVIGNTFRFTGPAPVTQNAIAVVVSSFTPGMPASAIVASNRFVGGWFAAVRVSGAVTAPSGPAVITGNLFDGSVRALRCEGTVPEVVRAANFKRAASLDECPQATAGY